MASKMKLFIARRAEKRDLMYLLILLGVSVLLRILIYILSVHANEVQGVSPIDRLYYEGLRYHIFEYLWYTTNIPPFTHILNAMVFRLFTPEIAYGKYIFLLFIFILDVWSVCLLYSAARKLGFYRGISFSIALFYSLTIIPFEMWRFGTHYDHHTLFLTVLYIYSISRVYSNNNLKNAALMSLAGALMVAQSSVSSVVIPIISMSIAIILNYKQGFKELIKRAAIVIIAPAIVILLIASKNYSIADNFTTSIKSGPAMMMFVRSALKNDNDRIRNFIQETGVPEWYLHCFDNSVTPPHVPPDNPNYAGWLALAKDFGICFPWSPDYPMDVEVDTWPFDFKYLKDYFHEHGEYDIENLVAQDQNDMRYRKYLLAGYSQELSPRWIGIYGQVSMQVGKQLFLKSPVKYLKNIVRTHNGIYFSQGPAFFRITLYSNKKPHSLSTLSSPMFGEDFFYAVTSVYELLAKITYMLIPVYFTAVGFLYLLHKRNYFKQAFAAIKENWYVGLFLAMPVILVSLIFSSMSDIENDRYFVQITPYLMLLMGYFLMFLHRLYRLSGQRLLQFI